MTRAPRSSCCTMPWRRRFRAGSCWAIAPAIGLLAGQADEDPAVTAAREALGRWQWPARYPWYDPAGDGVARVDVSEPWYEKWKLDWLWDWLESLDFSGPRLSSMRPMEWVVWIGMLLLIGLLAYLLIRAFRRGVGDTAGAAARAAPSTEADRRRRAEALPLHEGRKRSDLLAEAQRHYQQGDYREAVIYLFSHQLVELDKRQFIHLAKGKTNRQYVRELGRRTVLRQLLGQTMVAFEDVFFGNQALDRNRFEACWFRLGEFEAMVAEGAV